MTRNEILKSQNIFHYNVCLISAIITTNSRSFSPNSIVLLIPDNFEKKNGRSIYVEQVAKNVPP